jgi:hypothetical protein
MTPVAAPSAPRVRAASAPSVLVAIEPMAELDRVARGLRGARARTHLSEGDVVAILARQGIALSVPGLRRAESTGAIPLALASRLADLYGTTTDRLAGRRIDRRRPSLSGIPNER